jgi:hypothetical protein
MAGYVTGVTGTGPTATISVIIYDSGFGAIGALDTVSYAAETTYTLKTIDFVVPNGAAYISLNIGHLCVVAGPSEFFIDNITTVPKRR